MGGPSARVAGQSARPADDDATASTEADDLDDATVRSDAREPDDATVIARRADARRSRMTRR